MEIFHPQRDMTKIILDTKNMDCVELTNIKNDLHQSGFNNTLVVHIGAQKIKDWNKLASVLTLLPPCVGVLRIIFESSHDPLENTHVPNILDRLPVTFDELEFEMGAGWEAEQERIEEMIHIKFEGL